MSYEKKNTFILRASGSQFTCAPHNIGYNDIDFCDKMEPPRPEIDLKWDSRTHL
jgi:hypothetical protein